jgi:hypothetical protein
LGIACLDAVESLSYVLDLEDEFQASASSIINESTHQECLVLRQDVLNAIDGLADKKGANKKKGAATTTPQDRVTAASFEINDSFVSQLPPSLIRRCLASKIQSSSVCRQKGFVLDCWTPIIQNAVELDEVLVRSDNPSKSIPLTLILEIQVDLY